MERMKQASVVCDLLLILGTSLSTHPVSECVRLFDHCDLLVLNQSNIQIPERGDGVKTVQILGFFRELFGEDGDADGAGASERQVRVCIIRCHSETV